MLDHLQCEVQMAAHTVPDPVGLHAFYSIPLRKVRQRVLHGLQEQQEKRGGMAKLT